MPSLNVNTPMTICLNNSNCISVTKPTQLRFPKQELGHRIIYQQSNSINPNHFYLPTMGRIRGANSGF